MQALLNKPLMLSPSKYELAPLRPSTSSGRAELGALDPFPIKSAQTDRIRKGLALDEDHYYPDQLASQNDSSWSGNGLASRHLFK
jgi:hypothetical protein